MWNLKLHFVVISFQSPLTWNGFSFFSIFYVLNNSVGWPSIWAHLMCLLIGYIVCSALVETIKKFSKVVAFNMPSHQQFTAHPHKHLVFSVLFNFSHSGGCVVEFQIVWIDISLMTNDVEHLFMCLLATWKHSFVKLLSKNFTHFKNRFVCHWFVWVH